MSRMSGRYSAVVCDETHILFLYLIPKIGLRQMPPAQTVPGFLSQTEPWLTSVSPPFFRTKWPKLETLTFFSTSVKVIWYSFARSVTKTAAKANLLPKFKQK